MVKPGLGIFAGRRKSTSNVLEAVERDTPPAEAGGPESGSGGFRLMSTVEAEKRKKEEKRKAQERAASKFRPFSAFGAGGKGRNHSFDDESPPASNRDSKSSSGTQSSRPYNSGHFGSTSTLPSSADADANDMFAGVPRPAAPHFHSSPGGVSAASGTKQLPSIPHTEQRHAEPTRPVSGIGRMRAMTSSSYASTAKAPVLDGELNFGSSSFDDMFSGLDRQTSPEPAGKGRSLLAGRRTVHTEPIRIDQSLEVEAPLASWESRGSAEKLMSSRSPDDDSPPPVPPHRQGKYAPVATRSPGLDASPFMDDDAKFVPQSVQARRTFYESVVEKNAKPSSSSSTPSLPPRASTASTSTTPKAARPGPSDEYEDTFAPDGKGDAAPKAKASEARPSVEHGPSGRRVMTQAEFRAQQRKAIQSKQESSDSEDYEDEEDAEERAAQEAIARRKKQQMDLARDSIRRTLINPSGANRTDSVTDTPAMGFPSETSLKADEWEDEDVPLGILAQHGFPSATRNRAPTQPANAMPSYFSNPNQSVPDRPASVGAMSSRASQAFRPAFARNLPEDPHAAIIGGGLVRPTNRESMGFGRGPASVAGDYGGMYEPPLSTPSLVEQIHMRDMSKPKYTGGASGKKAVGGPFTGAMGSMMNGPTQNTAATRMGQPMNAMNAVGVNGMMPMMNMGMMGGPMGPMGMPMMGMNGMAYPMTQNDMLQQMQMQQMLATQHFMQMQQQQMHAQGQFPDPRMSMAYPPNLNGGFLGIPNGPPGQRPTSVLSVGNPHPPMSAPGPMAGGFQPPQQQNANGYAPSIAPSERSNIGLSPRYRPVTTAHDAASTVSGMTLQAPGAKTVKGILKKKAGAAEAEDEDGWGRMRARKGRKEGEGRGAKEMGDDEALRELVGGLDRL